MHRLTPHDTKCLQEYKQYIKGNLYLHVNIGRIIKLFLVQKVKVPFIVFFYFFLSFLLLFINYNDAKVAGTCEYGDEPSGSKNAGNFLTSCRTS